MQSLIFLLLCSEYLVSYVGHFKSSAHCTCMASRMMQSFWFSRQL